MTFYQTFIYLSMHADCYAYGCLYICVVSTGHLECYNVLMILNVGGKIIVGSDPCMYCTCLEEVYLVLLMCLCLVVYIFTMQS